ncbi:hypothetical protein QZH41_015883, partial [Actinostola sp. cb2023]
SICFYTTEKYGKQIWQQVLAASNIETTVFVTQKLYSEDLIFKLADGALEILGEEEDMTLDDVMRYFGVCFVKFFNHYGYDPIIRVSGRHFRDFMIGIDNLHEHMRFGYPKMQSPAFYCDEETSSGLNLHYVSRRKGFMFYVIGQVEEIARKFYDIYDLTVKVLSNEIEGAQCHIVYRLGFMNCGFKPPTPDLLCVPRDRFITVDVFFTIFPFSFAISTDMTINMSGNGLISMLVTRKVVFELLARIPVIRRKAKDSGYHKTVYQTLKRSTSMNEFPSQNHKQHKPGNQSASPTTINQTENPPTLHLRGQMKYIQDWDKILYICSPLIGSLDDMLETGLYMNDFSMHDTSQEMVLSGLKPLPQLEYARDQQFEQGRELEQCMKKLNKEREKSDELLHQMIPKEIADRLKRGESPIDTCEFETLGDALYMAVSGVPTRKKCHIEPMAAMALDMLSAVQKVKDPITKKAMTVTIGIHTGPVIAGLVGEMTLQYCLFGDTVNIASRLRTTA